MDTEGQLWAPSAQRSFAVAIFLLIDMSNGPKTPLSPATCICPATGAAAGRRHRPRRLAAGGTEPGAAHKGRAASLTQTPPRRRPADSSVREGRLPRRERHAAAPTHAPRDPLSRGFPRLPPRVHVTARLVAGERGARGLECACVLTCAPARSSRQEGVGPRSGRICHGPHI